MPSRTTPFVSVAEVEQYLGHDEIECLECGRRYRNLGKHLGRSHGIDPDAYRAKWALPAMTPLAGEATRRALSEGMRQRIADGAVSYDHLNRATEAARSAIRYKQGVAREHHRERVIETAPWDTNRLAPGAHRADGRDADRARKYQRKYRATKAGK